MRMEPWRVTGRTEWPGDDSVAGIWVELNLFGTPQVEVDISDWAFRRKRHSLLEC